MADVDEARLAHAAKEVGAIANVDGATNVIFVPTDVSQIDQVVRLKERVYETWGEVRTGCILAYHLLTRSQVAVLINNAGVAPKGTSWSGIDNWRKAFDVNVFGWV